MMVTSELTYIKLSEVSLLPYNPRKIKKADFDRLIDSIKINGFWKHRPLAIEVQDGKNFVLCGNQRVKAAKKLKLKEVPAVFYSELTDDERVDLITRDNISNGEWDQTVLYTDPHFQDLDFEFMGLILPGTDDDQPKKKKGKKKQEAETDPEGSGEDPEEEDFPDEPTQEQKMLDDVLFPSNNQFEIPTLLKEMEAGRVILPITPWGANSRLRKDVNTYHFYVDDYRFEKLFKDPTNLINSGVQSIVEPNCSCHDQTPIAYGISLIYKKRWLARYCQELGIKVYADLNVAHKFIEYNMLGIPEGYNAFFTRGCDGWMESLKSDLEVAQRISGLDVPNLVVYGGGTEIQEFCQKKGILYLSDFINAKKI